MKPCKNLDYETEFIDCELIQLDDFPIPVKYWKRGATWIEGEKNKGNPEKVQFCKHRGRINSIFACYDGDMSCYEIEKENDNAS